jgi:hypothetical protein
MTDGRRQTLLIADFGIKDKRQKTDIRYQLPFASLEKPAASNQEPATSHQAKELRNRIDKTIAFVYKEALQK